VVIFNLGSTDLRSCQVPLPRTLFTFPGKACPSELHPDRE
jgi:hypothetical protein